MKPTRADSDYKQEEAEKRRDDLLRSLLHTPGVSMSALPVGSGEWLANRLVLFGGDATTRKGEGIAREAYDAAAWADPGNPIANLNLVALELKDDPVKALAHAETALRMDPTTGRSWYERGVCRYRLGDYEGAFSDYTRALEAKPGDRDTLHNIAVTALLTGRFQVGWSAYRYRLTCPRNNVPKHQIKDRWEGGKVYLIHEQGIGDALFFGRWIPLLKRKGVSEIWAAWPEKIAPVMRRAFPYVRDGFGDSECAQFWMGDLPFMLREGGPVPAVEIPVRGQIVNCGRGPQIGVTWRAGGIGRLGRMKECDPRLLIDIAVRVGGTPLLMQRDMKSDEERQMYDVAPNVTPMQLYCDDPDDALDVLSQLDAYIGVPNTNVHLAMGLPKDRRPKMHILVPHPPEPRWMAKGDESPWFPGVRVHRQNPDGSWPSDIADKIAEDIRA